MFATLRRLVHILREPVLAETRANLARSWARLPEDLRGAQQMLGRAGNGCGATIGLMPRCDFACRGCYLGAEANRVPAAPLDTVKAQMGTLRPALGNAGNLQFTDGEVTLRPVSELIELLQHARRLGLIPMLMTHGDSFRRRPGLLDRLMVEGGLTELSIHIDVTQRGRLGPDYRRAGREEELTPLREEFAAMIRGATRRTGLPLRVATTMTVTGENLAGVPSVVRWVMRNADAFRMISFQPVAAVGRTEGDLETVAVEPLWARIAEGLYGSTEEVERARRGQMWIGHPACNRYLAGMVLSSDGRTPAFHAVRQAGDALDEQIVDGFLRRFGGFSFRLDSGLERIVRCVSVAARDPAFMLPGTLRWIRHWLRRLDPAHPGRLALRLACGQARLRSLVIVSHHFMTAAEAATPPGQDRLALCVFRVPVGERLVPMCTVNAGGIRDAYYEELRSGLGRDIPS